jgi:hypothetical protein
MKAAVDFLSTLTHDQVFPLRRYRKAFTTQPVAKNENLLALIKSIPQNTKTVFIPGNGNCGEYLERSLDLLTRLQNKGVASIKIGGWAIDDISQQIATLRAEQN